MSNQTKATQVSLEQVLENELVLLDGSISGSSICKDLFGTSTYNDLQEEILKPEIKNIQQFLKILENPNTKMTPEVLKELGKYKKIIEDRASSYSENHKNLSSQLGKGKKFKKPQTDHKKYNGAKKKIKTGRKLFKRLTRRLTSIQKSANNRLLTIQNPRYELLSDMICLISKVGDLKKDTGAKYGKEPKNPYNSNTDERMVATAYWQSLNEETESVILSSDNDIARLLGVTPRLLCLDEFSKYNQEFTNALLSRPPTLYLLNNTSPQEEIRKHTMDNLIYKYEKKAIKLEGNQELMNKLEYLWRRFSRVEK